MKLLKVKVKFMHFIKYHTKKAYEGVEQWFHISSTLTLDDVWSASCPISTHYIVWVDTRAMVWTQW
jgi:hypothetical protein